MGIAPHIDSICHIKDAGVILLGVAKTITINEKGERYTKRRVTHDCSFWGPSGLSVNNQVLRDTLHLCFYGFFPLRMLQMIAAMCIKWPSKCILIGETDLDAAYRHVHANAQIASICIAIVKILAFLCLCLPFGNTPALEEYTTISKT